MVFLVRPLPVFPCEGDEKSSYVIDLSAAAHADVLFTKEMANGDSDLLAYCKREKISYVPFTDL